MSKKSLKSFDEKLKRSKLIKFKTVKKMKMS